MSKATILDVQQIQDIQPSWDILPILNRSIAEKAQTIVFNKQGNKLSLLTTNNFPTLYRQVVDKLTAQGYEYTSHYTDDAGFAVAMKRFDSYEKTIEKAAADKDRRMTAAGKDAIGLIKDAYAHVDDYTEGDFISEILRLAYQSGASDVHFQSEEMGIVMRLRIDGVLTTAIVMTHEEFQKYLMKIKYMSGMKMNISKTMQDGRFDFDIKRADHITKIDVRVSALPGIRGESITLRFLDASQDIMQFAELGCESYQIAILEHELKRNYGLILVTGPTGSGKTTTVYSLLNYINDPSKKIITLENPVEYEMPGIEQSQINAEKGYDFENALKGVLRHDPDIIMVGEIRTLETAEMAVNAALTGHLVISTLHTNTAVEAINRLLNMGVKPFMLASSLNCVIGQRLLRKVTHPTSIPAPPYVDTIIKQSLQKIHQYPDYTDLTYTNSIVQSDKKTHEAYAGRVAVYEMMQVDATIKQMILDGAGTLEIDSYLHKQHFLTMQDNGVIKMLQDMTTREEVERVLS